MLGAYSSLSKVYFGNIQFDYLNLNIVQCTIRRNILKDTILDIVRHTAGPGFFELAKITGTDEETEIWSCDEKKTVVLDAKLKSPAAGLIGEVGLFNLGFLNGLCNLYNKEGGEVTITSTTKHNENVPEYIQFSDNDGNNGKYRFMAAELIPAEYQPSTFRGVKWDTSFDPTKNKVLEMNANAGVYSSIEPTFTAKIENNELIFIFGNVNYGYGHMVFAKNVSGSMKESQAFPIDKFLSILKLGMSGECKVHFAQHVCMITIDNGVGVYNYILPGHTR
jgi:hypothetical protein